jgi:hypothetical protein
MIFVCYGFRVILLIEYFDFVDYFWIIKNKYSINVSSHISYEYQLY